MIRDVVGSMIRATMNSADGREPEGEGMAGRLLLMVDALVPAAVHQACADLAARLADQSGLPVTVATAPIARLDAIRDAIGRDTDARRREYAPLPRPAQSMSSAPFLWRDDGRPDWSGMWTTFCELALYSGPPQRGPRERAAGAGGPVRELRRGKRGREAGRVWGNTRTYGG